MEGKLSNQLYQKKNSFVFACFHFSCHKHNQSGNNISIYTTVLTISVFDIIIQKEYFEIFHNIDIMIL